MQRLKTFFVNDNKHAIAREKIERITLDCVGPEMLAELVYRCSVELGSIFNDPWLVSGPDFIPESDVVLICPGVELTGSIVITVESMLHVLRGEVDHTRESGVGLGSVGRPVDGVAPGGLRVMKPFIDVTNGTWKPVALLHWLSE